MGNVRRPHGVDPGVGAAALPLDGRGDRGRRRAVVTGASSGIGQAFAAALSAEGFEVVLVARDPVALRATAERIAGPSEPLVADLSSASGLDRVEARLRSMPVDLLVNNAATGQWGPFADQDPAGFEETIAVNVLAVARLTRAVLPGMIAARRGGLITVSSPAGARPAPMLAVYGASKAFVDALDASIRAELRESGAEGITVTTVWPGWTRTGFHARLDQDTREVPDRLWVGPDLVARDVLRRHRLGHATVRVPEPSLSEHLLGGARRARRSVPEPARALMRRLRRTLTR